MDGSLRGALSLTRCLMEELTLKTPREFIRELNRRPIVLLCTEVKVGTIIDGDTIRVTLAGEVKERTIRIRGVDTPEMMTSEVNGEDETEAPRSIKETRPLGIAARERLVSLLQGRRVFAHLQRRPGRADDYVSHHGCRVLAYLSLDSAEGQDVGELLIREGYALVWPRHTRSRRYLHPKMEGYVTLCNAALEGKPGLWGKGLGAPCPCILSGKKAWSLENCKRSCFRRD